MEHEMSIELSRKLQENESNRKKLIHEAIEAIFVEIKTKFPNVVRYHHIGYTPEWNDGEECNHYYGATFGYYRDDLLAEQDEVFEEYYGDDLDSYAFRKKVDAGEAKSIDVPPADDMEEYTDRLDELFQLYADDNYHIIVRLDDSNIDVEVIEYDCGY